MHEACKALAEHLRGIHAIERAGDVLRWDQQTTMPTGGIEARAGELSQLARLVHERWTSNETGRRLDAARSQAETEEGRALVREASWLRKRRVKVPDELIEEISERTSRAHGAWVQAKRESDFERFAEHLERILELKRDYAEAIDPDREPYAVLFEDHEPWLGLDRAIQVVDEVAKCAREALSKAPPAHEQADPDALAGPWPVDVQRELLEDLLEQLGYDLQHGVLGQAEHPFSTGNRYDARIATHLHEDDLISGLTSTVHEFGHASYTQGLPERTFATPLGESRDLVVHESQSRLWENHVARSLPFWEWLKNPLQERFDERIDPRAAWQAANVVQPSLIRVDADEVSYHLHIKLRTDLERRLVAGDLDVHQLPQAWNDRMDDLLGVRPDQDREGVLQDVHWSHGSIGYFPTYTLGSALAAQLAEAVEDELGGIDELVEQRRFASLLAWLRRHVHRHGSRFTTEDLVREATGRSLDAQAFEDHVRNRFLDRW